MHFGVINLLLAHESPSLEDEDSMRAVIKAGLSSKPPPGEDWRGATRFETFFSCSQGTTPRDLVLAGGEWVSWGVGVRLA